jgi:hypothetical protein
MNTTIAKALPASIFDCGFSKTVKDTPALCENVKEESSCSGAVEADGEKCYWCESAAVSSSCFNLTIAEGLPPTIFDCGFKFSTKL